MSSLQAGIPAAVYRHLPESWALADPLPPVHTGSVFHYTSLVGVHGLIQSGVAWASHAMDLNDPTERIYGWDVIRSRFAARPLQASSHAMAELEKILADADEPGEWYPRPYVLSASADADSLTQYRLYGQVQVELAGGVWTSSRDRDLGGENKAEWRPVLYGPTEADAYVDRMLAAAVAIMDSTPEYDYTDESLLAMLALEHLALHIKHPAYRDEHEVRLVFSSPTYLDDGRVRLSGTRLVTFAEATPAEVETPGVIRSVRLGPLAGGVRNEQAIKLLLRSYARPTTPGLFDDPNAEVEVTTSLAPYRHG